MQAYKAPDGAINAIVRSRDSGKYQVVDITGVRLIDLNALYRVVEVPVIDTFDRELTIELSTYYRTDLINSTLTYSEWLVANANNALITSEGFPVLKLGNVRYMAGFWHEGSYKLTKTGWHPSNDVEVDDMHDLIVDLKDIEAKYLYEHTLWSVGGYFLRTKYQDYGVRVVDAGNVIRRGKSMTLGMLNTESVGKVQTVEINEYNLSKLDATKSYYDKVIIGTDVSLTGKTVGIVLGGHLHLLDNFVNVISDKAVTISMKNFKYLERIIESKNALDLTFMGADDISGRSVVSQMLTDENIKKYLCCPYTFLVVFDNPHMFRETIGGDHKVGLSNIIIDDIDSFSYGCDKNGRMIDFWPTYNNGQWTLNYDRYLVDNWLAQTTAWESLQYINDARHTAKPVDGLHAYLYTFTARV